MEIVTIFVDTPRPSNLILISILSKRHNRSTQLDLFPKYAISFFFSRAGEDELIAGPLFSDAELNNINSIGTVDPVRDFNLMICKNGNGGGFKEIANQMQQVIYDLLFRTTNLQLEKIVESFYALRRDAKIFDPSHYNEWIVEFKDILLSRNRVAFWNDVIVKKNYGLISENESKLSSINEESQKEFYEVGEVAENLDFFVAGRYTNGPYR